MIPGPNDAKYWRKVRGTGAAGGAAGDTKADSSLERPDMYVPSGARLGGIRLGEAAGSVLSGEGDARFYRAYGKAARLVT
jgi:hypothetical protein